MALKRVTMQDIADACGLSRNTVSKVFNGRGAVPQATRALILQKASELGYGLPSAGIPASQPSVGNTIALLTSNMPVDYHFGTTFVSTFTDQICRAGYTLKMFEVSSVELRSRLLPPHFIPDQMAGIVAIELFDADYLDMIASLGLPAVVIDSPAHSIERLMRCDYVSMENYASILAVVRHLYDRGARRFGFVGDTEHCGSFYARWFGFRYALNALSLSWDERFSILAPDSASYSDPEWLMDQVGSMPSLPDAFVCANDYLAIHLMNALKRAGFSVPGSVMITGFDGSSQSALVDPPLTTVQIPSVEIGRLSADILLSRIRNPEAPFTWTRVATTPLWRGSTDRR